MKTNGSTAVPKCVSLLLVAVAFALGGCVYLHLMELKKQFASFDQYFVVQPTEDFELRCLKPVLTGSDVRWIGAEPKTIRPWKNGEEWSIRWIKLAPSEAEETLVYDMEFIARIADDRLVEAAIPKRYFAYFPKELFVNLLRSTGTAKVDRTDRQVESQTETPPATALPNLKSIRGMLGAPTKQSTDKAGQLVYFYLYRLDLPEPDSKPVEMTFLFDHATGDLRKLIAKLPHGTLKYDFAKPPPPSPAPPAEKPVHTSQPPPLKSQSQCFAALARSEILQLAFASAALRFETGEDFA